MPHNYYRKGEEHQVEREQTPGWRIIVRRVPTPAWILGGLVLLLALIVVGYRYQITLWDWLKLLIVPAVLAGGGIWFNKQQRDRELKIADKQRERELEIADQRTQDEALQAYLDQMSHLLTDKELRRTTDWLDEARITARARSLAALGRMDGEHRKSVLQFLYEAQLINRRESTVVEGVTYELGPARIVGLSGADLRSADLRYIYLSDAALNGALLDNADLREAKLRDIDLGGAYLSGADFRGADLRGASLINAELQRKDELNLSGADLSGADLRGADLRGADLRGARGLTQEQVDLTIGSNKAELPEGLNRPQWWSKGIEEQRRIVQESGGWEDEENSNPS
jgi:Pentapeptide repeats (8 copies)